MARRRASHELTYPLRSAARLTGLSPELLRAWERRHAAVSPQRTPGGTRRYRAADLERLRLLKAAVDAGHRIGQLAELSDAQLSELASAPEPEPAQSDQIEAVLAAIDVYDGAEAQRLLSLQLSVLGALRFARELVLPLVYEIGDRWASERLGVGSEHLATAVLRSMLGSSLLPSATALRGARVVFATIGRERHELGLLMAALTAMGAGANPVYLGPEVPVEDLLQAVSRSGAAALGVSVVSASPAEIVRLLARLRRELPANVHLWIGGAGSARISLPRGVERLENLVQLEQRVSLLAFEPRRR